MADKMVWTNISAYVDEKADDIKAQLSLGGQSLQFFNVIPVNNEGSIKVPRFTVSVVEGSNCTETPTGATTMYQRTITVNHKTYLTDICKDNFRQYFPVQIMNSDLTDKNNIPYGEKIIKSWSDAIEVKKELAAWTAIYSVLSADTARNILTSYTGVTITSSNVDEIIDGIYAGLPATVTASIQQKFIFMSYSAFVKLKQNYHTAYGTLSQGNVGNTTPNTIEYPVDNSTIIVGVKAFDSLSMTNYVIAIAQDNTIYATNPEGTVMESGLTPRNSGIFLRFENLQGFGYHDASEISVNF